ncbi:MAG: hypothetical protein E7625_06080 [Ruminococcaceae bacterium]|nr:hypothetical protein [Oscillospiraceae bacterium]
MPDMTEAKKIVARRYRTIKQVVICNLIFWFIAVAALTIVSADNLDGSICFFAIGLLCALALPFLVLLIDSKKWRMARRDIKNRRLIQKETKLTVARYRSGYRGSFSAHLVDRDCEQYQLFVKTFGQALSLSPWLKNIPATIEYLEGSHFAVVVYLDIPSTAIIPEKLLPLFEGCQGYTRFVKGKKKENT